MERVDVSDQKEVKSSSSLMGLLIRGKVVPGKNKVVIHEGQVHVQSDKQQEYADMFRNLKSDLRDLIPTTLDFSLLTSLCTSIVAANDAWKAAQAAQKALPKDASQEAKDAAAASVAKAQTALEEAKKVGLEASPPILDKSLTALSANVPLYQLCQYIILLQGDPKRLGTFANENKEQEKLMDDFLKDKDKSKLRMDMLHAGGANNGAYGQALLTYNKIRASPRYKGDSNDDDVFYRLALACSLELCVPRNYFDQEDVFIDPVARYFHFQDAYLYGELDPTFNTLSAWHLRMAVDCDAQEEQMAWGRSMLRNYRPDQVLLDDMQWRYCRSVRTEVGYRKPDWGPEKPRTYQKLISGGGECGPRAWFGRYICKSHGIPTWGVRQPGHAALTHWTPDKGWKVCLGADWVFSNWNGRWGPDFHVEAQAREANQDDYFQKVCLLHWVGDVLGEGPLNQAKAMPDPSSPWRSLSWMQTSLLAQQQKIEPLESTNATKNWRSSKLLAGLPTGTETIQRNENRTIVLPAANCSSPTKSTAAVAFLPSFSGGQQLHVREHATWEYMLSEISGGSHNLSIRIVNVHEIQVPLTLMIEQVDDNASSSIGSTVMVSTIPIPYTRGEWIYTDPAVVVDLHDGTNKLTFSRQLDGIGGISIKDLTFEPVS